MGLSAAEKAALRELPHGQEIIDAEEAVSKPALDSANTLFWLDLWAAILSAFLLIPLIVSASRDNDKLAFELTLAQKVTSITGHSIGSIAVKLVTPKLFIGSIVINFIEIIIHSIRIATDSRLVSIILTKLVALMFDIAVVTLKLASLKTIRKLSKIESRKAALI
ncbi:hypothetical protein HDE_13569 [Halotydeus destructor]|nr:hypothetical protein HDE_13569 [Halotydeus destructor]